MSQMGDGKLTKEMATKLAGVLAFFQMFPVCGATTRHVTDEEVFERWAPRLSKENIIRFPPKDWPFGYACKLCTAEQAEFHPTLFNNEDDFLQHLNARHAPSERSGPSGRPWFHADQAAHPGMLADAEACALGYLICGSHVNEGSIQMLCFRCNVRFETRWFIERKICPVCGRQYRDYYPDIQPEAI